MKIGYSFCYNSYTFKITDFINFMNNTGITCWEISNKEIFKNGYLFQNEWTQMFLQQYGGTVNNIKEQPSSMM